MPHSLRAKLSGLRYKGILEDKDYKRLCHALDLEKAEQEPCEKCEVGNPCLYCKHEFSQKIEPCDDAISCTSILKYIDDWWSDSRDDIEDLIIYITYLPSVTQKSGKRNK